MRDICEIHPSHASARNKKISSQPSRVSRCRSDPFVAESKFTMNTAVQLWDGQLSVIATPIPHVSAPNEVLVKVAFSGVCGTDLHILAGEFPYLGS